MTDRHFYEPRLGHGLAHDPLNAIVAPRPIGWISTLSASGVANLAPYSFFNPLCYTPPIIAFSSQGWKDSVANAEATGEFVWNLATRAQAEAMNATSAMVSAEVDEFELAGLGKTASRMVAPPGIVGSPVQFECKVTRILQLTTKEGTQIPQWLVMGEAVGIHIDRDLIEEGVYQTAKAHPITRGGGPADYFEITQDRLFSHAPTGMTSARSSNFQLTHHVCAEPDGKLRRSEQLRRCSRVYQVNSGGNFMRIPYLLAATYLVFTPVFAQAQSDPAAQAETVPQNGAALEKNVFAGNYLTLGGGAVYGPSYEGSNDYVIFAVPAVQGRVAGIGIAPRAGGAALNFVPSPQGAKIAFALGPVATYSGNRDRHIVDPVVAAAGRLKADISVGGNAGVSLYRVLDRYDSLSASVDVKWDIRGPHGGMEVSPSLSYVTPLSKAVLVTLAVSAKHVNDRYADYYYSVSPTQSVASGLPLYQARGGWASVGSTLLLGYSLSGDLRKGGLSLFAVGGYTRLMNDARYNPYTALRGSPTQLVGGGGLAVTF